MPVHVETFATVDEGTRALSSSRQARYFGGGTLLMRAVNAGDQGFDTLIRVTDPVLREIRSEGDRIVIGAGVTMAEIAASRDLAFLAPAARVIGGPAVRSAATVGGNLFARSPFGDFATALVALGATVRMAGSGGDIGIDDFIRDRERHALAIVRSVAVSRLSDPSALRFLKVSRVKPKGASVLTIAAMLPRAGSRSADLRVAYGGLAPTPVRAQAVETALEGASLDERGIARALEVATEGIAVETDALASDWYRREIAPVHLKRVLLGKV